MISGWKRPTTMIKKIGSVVANQMLAGLGLLDSGRYGVLPVSGRGLEVFDR